MGDRAAGPPGRPLAGGPGSPRVVVARLATGQEAGPPSVSAAPRAQWLSGSHLSIFYDESCPRVRAPPGFFSGAVGAIPGTLPTRPWAAWFAPRPDVCRARGDASSFIRSIDRAE
jgi:hypothetical protein